MWLFWLIAILILAFGFVVFFGAPYVPSKRKELEAALKKLYPLSANDTLVDIGSGDGIVLRTAAKKGAKAIGFELNPLLVILSRYISRREPTIHIRVANFWNQPLPRAVTIVYIFAVSRDMDRMERKLQSDVNRLQKPLKVMTYGCMFSSKMPIKSLGAHHLYDFIPLQGQKT